MLPNPFFGFGTNHVPFVFVELELDFENENGEHCQDDLFNFFVLGYEILDSVFVRQKLHDYRRRRGRPKAVRVLAVKKNLEGWSDF